MNETTRMKPLSELTLGEIKKICSGCQLCRECPYALREFCTEVQWDPEPDVWEFEEGEEADEQE